MTKCSTPGCNGLAECNPADTENGPSARDLDPVFCDACSNAMDRDWDDCITALLALGFNFDYIYYGIWS